MVFFTGDTGPSDAVVELAKGADLYVTETTSPEEVAELMKRNGAWQSKTPAEQEGWLRHMHEEHVTPEDIGKMAAKADRRPDMGHDASARSDVVIKRELPTPVS